MRCETTQKHKYLFHDKGKTTNLSIKSARKKNHHRQSIVQIIASMPSFFLRIYCYSYPALNCRLYTCWGHWYIKKISEDKGLASKLEKLQTWQSNEEDVPKISKTLPFDWMWRYWGFPAIEFLLRCTRFRDRVEGRIQDIYQTKTCRIDKEVSAIEDFMVRKCG